MNHLQSLSKQEAIYVSDLCSAADQHIVVIIQQCFSESKQNFC